MAARRLFLIAVALGLAASCVQDDGTRFNPIPGAKRLSTDRERELGWQFDQQVQAAIPLIRDIPVLEFIDELGQLMVDHLGEQPFDYRFRVVLDGDLNAFAVPGGYVYFHTGTLLAAGDVEELAGVLAHELAHVKGHHAARIAEDTAVARALTSFLGVAASAATGEIAPALAAEGINVAIQLRFTRQYEDEADRVGSVFVTRTGFSPLGMARFFERIVAEQKRRGAGSIPPYLYSHPDAADRIRVVQELAQELRPVGPAPNLGARFREMQARLGFLMDRERVSWDVVQPFDRGASDPELERAATLQSEGQTEAALWALERAEALAPGDPRVAFRRGELLMELGRTGEAIVAYRRAVFLDPNRPAVLLALGRAHRSLEHRRKAIFFLEQAAWRAGPGSAVRLQSQRELERLIFPMFTQAGFADGVVSDQAETVLGAPLSRYPADAPRLAWWGQLSPHYGSYRDVVRVRWIDPGGAVASETSPRRRQRTYLAAVYEPKRLMSGTWTLQLFFGTEVLYEAAVEVGP